MCISVIVVPGGQPCADSSKYATARLSVPRGVGSIVTAAEPPHVNSPAVAIAPETDGPDCRVTENRTAAGPGENVGIGVPDSPIGAILEPHPLSWSAATAANTTSLTRRLVTLS